jgi:predicted GNAT family N-acyltransferase
MKKTFIFREITRREELIASFKLRYLIYKNCHLKSFLDSYVRDMDLDTYDHHAKHYGLYHTNNLAGYIRVVLPKEQFLNADILSIKKEILQAKAIHNAYHNSTAPYPFLSYTDRTDPLWEFFKDSNCQQEKIAEGGRLVLRPEFRSIRTAKFLLESIFSIYFLLMKEIKYAVVTCVKDHVDFYRSYGFSPITNKEEYINENKIISLSIPVSSLSAVPTHLHNRINQMASEYTQTNKIIAVL